MATAGEDHSEEKRDQIGELEKAFQDCINILTTQEHFSPNESEETKLSVENTIQKFLDAARQTEAFFLSQRLQLSVQKPEQLLKEDIQDLRLELERKEKLVEKHHERLQMWINLLHRNKPPPAPAASSTATSSTSASGGGGPPPSSGGGGGQNFPPPGQSQGGGYPGPPQQPAPSMHQGGPQPGQYPGPPLPGGQGYNMPPPHQPPPSYPQNPLAHLEQNLSNIGMPDRR